MTARAVEHASARLEGLHVRFVEVGALAVCGFAAALLATMLRPDLALPLMIGAIWASFVSMRDYVRRQLLLQELAVDGDAQAIAAVQRTALRAAAPQHRRQMATAIRAALDCSAGRVTRVEANRARLEELEAALLDDGLQLDPPLAAALEQLTSSGAAFYGCTPPTDELGSRLQRILGGFGAPGAGEGAARNGAGAWARVTGARRGRSIASHQRR